MNPAVELPAVIELFVSAFVLLGAALALIGSFGLFRLRGFYDRVHAPTLGTTLGTGSVLIASMILFTAIESRLVLHEILIGVFMVITTPVTFMLLVRAARHRDDGENRKDVNAE